MIGTPTCPTRYLRFHVRHAISDFTSVALPPIVADIPFLFVAGILRLA